MYCPRTQTRQVIQVMLVRVSCKDLPGNPVIRHIPEVACIIQIIVTEALSCLEQFLVRTSSFLNNLLQRTISVLLIDQLISLISRQRPPLRTCKNVLLNDRCHLTLVPAYMGNQVFHRPASYNSWLY